MTGTIINKEIEADELPTTGYDTIERRNGAMLALAKSGRTFDDIGTRFSLTRARVQQILSRMGFDRKQEIKDTHSKILSLAAVGKTVGEIAAEVGKTFDYVDHYCRQNRLKVPRKSRVVFTDGDTVVTRKRPSAIADEVRSAVSAGMSTSDIASKLNQPYHTVYNLRRRLKF